MEIRFANSNWSFSANNQSVKPRLSPGKCLSRTIPTRPSPLSVRDSFQNSDSCTIHSIIHIKPQSELIFFLKRCIWKIELLDYNFGIQLVKVRANQTLRGHPGRSPGPNYYVHHARNSKLKKQRGKNVQSSKQSVRGHL